MKDEFLRLLRDDSDVQSAVRMLIYPPPDPDGLTLAQRAALYANQPDPALARAFEEFWDRTVESQFRPGGALYRPESGESPSRDGEGQ